ncbi:hypothetical protein ERJ75_001260700 [Trypanosoma vivax]|nr:hypothetical protein ERJ75_001260700 [Trypanosoma vivax]
METRGASAQRSEPNTQLPQKWPGTVFHAPTAGERQQPHANNSPQTTNVGLFGIQVLRDKLSVGPFKPEETIRTHEGTPDSEKILKPDGMPARIVKQGTLAHAAAAVIECDLDPRILTQLGKHAGTPELPCSTAWCLAHWTAILNNSAKLTSLM